MSAKQLTDDRQLIKLRITQVTLSKTGIQKQLSQLNNAINSLNEQLSANYEIEHSIVAQTHKVTTIKLRESLKQKASPLLKELRNIESIETSLEKEVSRLSRAIIKKQNKKKTATELSDFISTKKYEPKHY